MNGDQELRGRAGASLAWRGQGNAIHVNSGTLRLVDLTLVREGPPIAGEWGPALVVVGREGRLEATGCTFVNSAGAGVEVEGAAQVSLVRCSVKDAATTGVLTRDSANVQMAGGSVERCGLTGVHAIGASTVTLDHVTIDGVGSRGIEVADVAELTETDCVVLRATLETRAAFGLGVLHSAAAFVAAPLTSTEAASWLVASLREARAPAWHLERLVERARSRAGLALGPALPEPFASVLRCAEAVKGRLKAEAWAPVEVALWRTARPTCAALGLERPSFGAAWVVEREELLPRLSALGAEGDVLWTGDEDGVLARDGRLIARLDGSITTIAVRDGRALVRTRTGDAHLVDASTGAAVATWRQADVAARIQVVTPFGPDAILALCDRHGHPTDRCSRVLRVAPGTAAQAGTQLGISQGESIAVSTTAVYADTVPGSPHRIPLDGSAPTACADATITHLALADDPAGWMVLWDAVGLIVVSPDGDATTLRGAHPWGLKFLLAGGRWLATLPTQGPATLWSVKDAAAVSTFPCQPLDAVRLADAIVILDRDGHVRRLRVFEPDGAPRLIPAES